MGIATAIAWLRRCNAGMKLRTLQVRRWLKICFEEADGAENRRSQNGILEFADAAFG